MSDLHPTVSDQARRRFFERDGQIQILDVGQRVSAEDRIAVVSFLQLHVRLIGSMRQIERVAHQIDLPMMVRTRHAVIDFL